LIPHSEATRVVASYADLNEFPVWRGWPADVPHEQPFVRFGQVQLARMLKTVPPLLLIPALSLGQMANCLTFDVDGTVVVSQGQEPCGDGIYLFLPLTGATKSIRPHELAQRISALKLTSDDDLMMSMMSNREPPEGICIVLDVSESMDSVSDFVDETQAHQEAVRQAAADRAALKARITAPRLAPDWRTLNEADERSLPSVVLRHLQDLASRDDLEQWRQLATMNARVGTQNAVAGLALWNYGLFTASEGLLGCIADYRAWFIRALLQPRADDHAPVDPDESNGITPSRFLCNMTGQFLVDPVSPVDDFVCNRAAYKSFKAQYPNISPVTGATIRGRAALSTLADLQGEARAWLLNEDNSDNVQAVVVDAPMAAAASDASSPENDTFIVSLRLPEPLRSFGSNLSVRVRRSSTVGHVLRAVLRHTQAKCPAISLARANSSWASELDLEETIGSLNLVRGSSLAVRCPQSESNVILEVDLPHRRDPIAFIIKPNASIGDAVLRLLLNGHVQSLDEFVIWHHLKERDGIHFGNMETPKRFPIKLGHIFPAGEDSSRSGDDDDQEESDAEESNVQKLYYMFVTFLLYP
jgi:hypothetical protein